MTMRAAAAALLFALFLETGIVQSHVDPGTGRIRILFLGEYYTANRIMLDWISAEPRLQLTVVPCSLQNVPMTMAKKMTRLYVPRTYELLSQGYDALIFEDFGPMSLMTSNIENFRRSVEEGGLGLGLIEFANWAGVGSSYMDLWLATSLERAFPAVVDLTTDISASQGRTFYRVLQRDPIFNLPGVEDVPMNGGHQGDIFPKAGSVVQAEWKGRRTPALITGKYGAGETLQLDHGWDNMLPQFRSWEYGPDLIYNEVFFLADAPVPEDLEITHKARKLFVEVRIRRVVTVSTLDFIETFGGKTAKAERKFRELEDEVEEAKKAYVRQNDASKAAEMLTAVIDEYPALEAEMLKIKRNALFWIYVIEWCVVTATATLTAALVWSLMVRRRLYKEVKTTRLVF